MDLEAIEKSRKLLIQCMGQANYDNFIENGRIQIKHKDPKDENKEIIYELDQEARVYNKTSNESYCIEPLAPEDLPIHDLLALKYSYIKNNIKKVEEVANKRSIINTIDTSQRPIFRQQIRRSSPDYSTFVEYMEGLGWMREQITLDELNSQIITVNDVINGSTSSAIEVKPPENYRITFMGTTQVPLGADIRTAHSLRVRFTNKDNHEIPDISRIRITKERDSDAVIQLARIFYSDINITKKIYNEENIINGTIFKRDDEWYRFAQGVELNSNERLKIYVVNPETDIHSNNTKFAVDCDMWSQ